MTNYQPLSAPRATAVELLCRIHGCDEEIATAIQSVWDDENVAYFVRHASGELMRLGNELAGFIAELNVASFEARQPVNRLTSYFGN